MSICIQRVVSQRAKVGKNERTHVVPEASLQAARIKLSSIRRRKLGHQLVQRGIESLPRHRCPPHSRAVRTTPSASGSLGPLARELALDKSSQEGSVESWSVGFVDGALLERIRDVSNQGDRGGCVDEVGEGGVDELRERISERSKVAEKRAYF